MSNAEVFVRQVCEKHLYLASVVAVNDAYSVGKAYAVFCGKSASCADDTDITARYFKRKACGYGGAFAAGNYNLGVPRICTKVKCRSARRCILRSRKSMFGGAHYPHTNAVFDILSTHLNRADTLRRDFLPLHGRRRRCSQSRLR